MGVFIFNAWCEIRPYQVLGTEDVTKCWSDARFVLFSWTPQRLSPVLIFVLMFSRPSRGGNCARDSPAAVEAVGSLLPLCAVARSTGSVGHSLSPSDLRMQFAYVIFTVFALFCFLYISRASKVKTT